MKNFNKLTDRGIIPTGNFHRSVMILKPGQMTHALIVNNDGNPEMCLLIKEEQPYLKKITYNPVLQFRVVSFIRNGVLVVVQMLKANNQENTLYETWFNHYNTIEGFSDIELLASQDELRIIIVNTSGEVVKIYKEENELKEKYQEFIPLIKKMYSWSMEEYNRCKRMISMEFPSITALWSHSNFYNYLRKTV